MLGVIALDAGDGVAARRYLEAALAAMPEHPVVVNALGCAMRLTGDVEAARATFARAGALGSIDGWRNLAGLESSAKNSDASIAAYERALRLTPGDVTSHAQLARLFEARHDLMRAKQHATAALRVDATNAIAGAALARVLVREESYVAAETAAAVVARAPKTSREDRATALSLIGDARDLKGDARGAFKAFTAANQVLLADHAVLRDDATHAYHPVGVRAMTAMVAHTDVAAWPNPVAFETPAPVFLIGFPRSGTTLLDQILSSHSNITCLEEKEHLSAALLAMFKRGVLLDGIAALTDTEIAKVRSEYWQAVHADTTLPPGTLIIDKLPLNIVVLPLIKAVFPDAKIILALRDPRDVVLSCFQQRFSLNVGMAQFLELSSAAAYYDVVMTLLELCRERLAFDLHQVRYEDVVADLETQARALTDFLGVPFEGAMLSYRETALKRDIATPSARQVIQPLYTRSISRWRRYAEDMAPALPVLNQWAARFGYDVV